jgi:hypothetical protein
MAKRKLGLKKWRYGCKFTNHHVTNDEIKKGEAPQPRLFILW